jgi:hypothetical protein
MADTIDSAGVPAAPPAYRGGFARHSPLTVEESLTVAPEASSAVRAQRFVRNVLARSDVEKDVAGAAVLLAKALINNGVIRARSDVAITVEVSPEHIWIEVAEEDPMIEGVGWSWGIATISR